MSRTTVAEHCHELHQEYFNTPMQGSNVRRDPAITVFQEPTTQTDLQLKIAVSVIVVNLKREAAFFSLCTAPQAHCIRLRVLSRSSWPRAAELRKL